MNESHNYFLLAGLVAALWMLCGVIVVGRRYPGYSHRQQVMSELGARGRPTAKIHPFINNFPLAFFFIVFGIALMVFFQGVTVWKLVGGAVVLHGICHALTGLFPCDENLGLVNPSTSQKIHNAAGLLMQLSLLFAIVVCITDRAVDRALSPNWFVWISVTIVIVSVVFLGLMIRSLSSGRNIGLYQRLSFAPLVAWVAILSVALFLAAQ